MSVEYQWDEVMKCVPGYLVCVSCISGIGAGAFALIFMISAFSWTDAPHSQHFQWSTTEVKPGVQVEVRNSPNARYISIRLL